MAGTAGYAAWLVGSAGARAPGWLLPAVIAVGVAAVAAALASVVVRRDVLVAVALAAGLVAGAAAPAVASATLVLRHQGSFDTPFEPTRQDRAIRDVFVVVPAQVRLTIPKLQQARFGAPYLLATQSAALASVFIYDTGLEALPIGGFTGTIPAPTLGQLQADIRQGKFHLVLTGTTRDPRLAWIARHCKPLGAASALRKYFCLPAVGG